MQSTETNNPRPIELIWYEWLMDRYLWRLYSKHYILRGRGNTECPKQDFIYRHIQKHG
jgi:hypothetical protein